MTINYRKCVSCGWNNPPMRFTCECCQYPLYLATKERIFELNRQLRQAIVDHNRDKSLEVMQLIKEAVESAPDVFSIDPIGYGTQIATVEKARAQGGLGTCICCGKEIGPAGWLARGHDVALQGQFEAVEMDENGEALIPDDWGYERVLVYEEWQRRKQARITGKRGEVLEVARFVKRKLESGGR